MELIFGPMFEAFRDGLESQDRLRLWMLATATAEDNPGEGDIWVEDLDDWRVGFDGRFVHHDLPGLWTADTARISNSNQDAAWDDQG